MHVLRRLGVAHEPRPDRPHRLVCDGDGLHLLRRDVLEPLGELDGADLLVEPRLVLLLGLSDAQARVQPLVEHALHQVVDHAVVVVEDRSSLRVPHKAVLRSHTLDHADGGGAGVGTLLLVEVALRSHLHTSGLKIVAARVEEGMGNEDGDLSLGAPFASTDRLRKSDCLVHTGRIHLPVAGDERLPHGERQRSRGPIALQGQSRSTKHVAHGGQSGRSKGHCRDGQGQEEETSDATSH
mmetsp:Transcript_32587/g.66131  ORF Transcript_32587/g.66131 Transcript_32587/m.66131 type:complete len:239 (-) Transcript_32587:19-735(-)